MSDTEDDQNDGNGFFGPPPVAVPAGVVPGIPVPDQAAFQRTQSDVDQTSSEGSMGGYRKKQKRKSQKRKSQKRKTPKKKTLKKKTLKRKTPKRK